MILQAVLDFIRTYFVDYMHMISVVFTRPGSLYIESVNKYGEEIPAPVVATLTPPPKTKHLINFPATLAINFFISIALGTYLYNPTLSFDSSIEMGMGLMLGVMFWTIYSIIVFSLFKLLKGTLNLVSVSVVCLQIVASVYIVSSILSFLSSVFLHDFLFYSISIPEIIYVVVQSMLLVVLLSVSLRDFIS